MIWACMEWGTILFGAACHLLEAPRDLVQWGTRRLRCSGSDARGRPCPPRSAHTSGSLHHWAQHIEWGHAQHGQLTHLVAPTTHHWTHIHSEDTHKCTYTHAHSHAHADEDATIAKIAKITTIATIARAHMHTRTPAHPHTRTPAHPHTRTPAHTSRPTRPHIFLSIPEKLLNRKLISRNAQHMIVKEEKIVKEIKKNIYIIMHIMHTFLYWFSLRPRQDELKINKLQGCTKI